MEESEPREWSLNKGEFDIKQIITFRRWLHQNPELSLVEFNTVAKIKETLLGFGIPEENLTSKAETGLILDFQGKAEEKGNPFRIAFRSDHDALPIQEANPHLPYQSTNGCAHMCGHDGHTACLVAACWILWHNLDKIPSNKHFRAVFQPGEEGFRGARKMIKDGCLEGVDEIYGMHGRPWAWDNVHKIIISDGEMYAHNNGFKVKVITFKINST